MMRLLNALEEAIARPGPSLDLLLAAAVRERCRPSAILDSWLLQHPKAPSDDVVEAMQTAFELESSGSPATDVDGSAAVELPAPVRLQILEQAGPERARALLGVEEGGDWTLTERTFRALLDGRAPSPEGASREELTAMGVALQWARSAGAPVSIDAHEIEAALARLDFTETLCGPDLLRFVGRERTLNALRQLWRLPGETRQTVLVEGAGGIGKSLTVARFLIDLLESGDPAERPVAVLHLDFDRFDLQRARVSTIFGDMIRQIARWWVPGSADRLAGHARELGAASLESVGQSARSSEYFRDDSETARLIADTLREHEPNRPLRLIVFADTYEQVDGFDDEAATAVPRACALLREAGADVMEIYASRTFSDPSLFARGRPPVRIRLSRLGQSESLEILRNEANRAGIALPRDIADAAQRKLRGWPLALRFAILLLPRDPTEFDPAKWLADLETSRERMQGLLYERVLKRIRDEDVRQLAKPGLLLRRLTAPIVAEVLARPCGLTVDETQAQALLQRARMEGQLFTVDPTDPEAVWHRRDVRELMIEDLRREIDDEVAKAIHRGAVEYYARSGDENVRDRAEEIYHRLQLSQGPEEIEPRWVHGAALRLKNVVGELPAAAAAYLRTRLGGASLASASSGGSTTAEALEEYRLLARKRLQSGDWNLSDIFATAGIDEEVVSPMGDLHAESLVLQRRLDEVVDGAMELALSNAPVPDGVRAAIFSCAAAVLEGQHLVTDALEYWELAHEAAAGEAPVVRLSYMVGLLRTGRKLGTARQERDRRRAEAAELMMAAAQPLHEHHVAARETVAELLDLIAERPGSPEAGTLARLASFLFEINEIFVSARTDPVRRREIGERLEMGTGDVPLQALNGAAMKFLYGPPDWVCERLAPIVRDEVDWSLERAVAPVPVANPVGVSA